MTSRFQDKFDRADGAIGANYVVPCGGVTIASEAVIPVDLGAVVSGISPLFGPGTTAMKTQVLYNAESMDGPDYVVRCTWAHDEVSASELDSTYVTSAPSFTILGRMTKDDLLFDLGVDEDPHCYDQGYGARVTFPLDGSAPVLKIVKLMPNRRLPGVARPASVEVDGAFVLATATLNVDDLNLDPSFDSTNYVQGDVLPYKGFWQDMRLRIRRADNEVILEVYLNDRNLNQPKLVWTDRQDPLWGAAGLPGFEFLSAQLVSQPAGVSPYSLAGLATLRCGIFSCETFLDVRRPVTISPGSHYTYGRVVNEVILLVEKNGDAKYNATVAGQTKIDTYLSFVLQAEADIIRKEGYYEWLRRDGNIYLIDGQKTYELPDDLGVLEALRPGNWTSPPLTGIDRWLFHQRIGSHPSDAGRPTAYTSGAIGPNNRQQIEIFPTPLVGAVNTSPPGAAPYLVVHYYARQLRPNEPDVQIPFVPQEHIDVLIWGAAAHALVLDTDEMNSQRVSAVYGSKLKDLRRANNRKISGQQTIFRSAGDVIRPDARSRVPMLRATQLETLLL